MTAPEDHPATTTAAWRQPEAWTARWRFWLPLLVACLVGLSFQGSRGLTETSETRYAECAREMLVSGNWLEPTLEFLPHWTKPPAAYWCIAAGMKLFGINTWGARLPGVMALLVATWAVGCIGRRLWGERVALASGLVFALGFPAVGATVVTTDIYLTAAETLAVAAFVLASTEPEVARRRRYACGMWAAWGLAFLVKGPPGLLPLLALIPWNRMQPRERRVPLADWRGLLCLAAVALPWYLAMLHRHHDLLSYYVGTEIVARVSSDVGHNLAWYKAFVIYGPAMLGIAGVFGPWAAALAWRGGWNRAERWRRLWAARDHRLLLVGWVVLPLVVFCLSRSKLPLYVLPLAAPAALLTGLVLAGRTTWTPFRTVAAVSLVALIGFKAVGGHLPNSRDMAQLARDVRAAQATLPAGAPVVFWDQPNNHGVTFYLALDRTALPERIAVGPKSKFEQWTPAEFAARVGAGRYQQGALLIVANKRRQTFQTACPGLPVETAHAGPYWQLLRLPPGK